MMTLDPDRHLLEALRRGRADSGRIFTLLHERHRERIHALCLRLTRNEEDAQDALQETFFAAAAQITSFRGEALFSTWLHRIAVNKCGEIRRRRRRRRALEEHSLTPLGDGAPFAGLADEGPLPSDEVSATERDRRVREAVESLPDWLRGAVWLRYFEQLSYQEISVALDLPVGTVKSRLFRAHRTLLPELDALSRTA